MSRDYRVWYWGVLLGGPPLLLAVATGLTAHRHRNRRTNR